MAIDVEQLQAGGLQPLDDRAGEAAHQLVAELVVGLALAAQARAVEGDRRASARSRAPSNCQR